MKKKLTKNVKKTATETWIENMTRPQLQATMFMDKACVSIPKNCKEVWIFRGSEHHKVKI